MGQMLSTSQVCVLLIKFGNFLLVLVRVSLHYMDSCEIQSDITCTVQPQINGHAKTSFCVRKPAASCGFLKVACAWILQDARTFLRLEVKTARTSLRLDFRNARTSLR